MTSQRAFGRRVSFYPQPLRSGLRPDVPVHPAPSIVPDVAADLSPAMRREIVTPYLSDRPQERELPTKRPFKLPWRQLSLLASLCFGIASFVLPDSVSDGLDWVLYGLMALSAYAGLSKRFRGS
jgi:hypothetical protein